MLELSTTALVLCAAVAAQPAAHLIPSPDWSDTFDGNGWHGDVLGSKVDLRWQQIDNTQPSPWSRLDSILWRRDATLPDSLLYVKRTIEIEVVLGHGDITKMTGDLDKNYLGPTTVVFRKKTVQLPDWKQQPIIPPALMDAVVFFDVLWNFNGQADLLWEVRITKNSGYPYRDRVNYPFDSHQVIPGSAFLQRAAGNPLGTGCVATGRTSPFSLTTLFETWRARMRFGYSLAHGPASAATLLHVDGVDRDWSVPGICTRIRSLPTLGIALGTTSPSGSIPLRHLELGYDRDMIGKTFTTQAVALDPGQRGLPAALSNGRAQRVPTAPRRQPALGHAYTYVENGKRVVAGPFAGGVVAGFLHQ